MSWARSVTPDTRLCCRVGGRGLRAARGRPGAMTRWGRGRARALGHSGTGCPGPAPPQPRDRAGRQRSRRRRESPPGGAGLQRQGLGAGPGYGCPGWGVGGPGLLPPRSPARSAPRAPPGALTGSAGGPGRAQTGGRERKYGAPVPAPFESDGELPVRQRPLPGIALTDPQRAERAPPFPWLGSAWSRGWAGPQAGDGARASRGVRGQEGQGWGSLLHCTGWSPPPAARWGWGGGETTSPRGGPSQRHGSFCFRPRPAGPAPERWEGGAGPGSDWREMEAGEKPHLP